MEESILNSVKKILNISPEDDAFDLDIITHINSAFSTLYQLGIGPLDGFMIEDDSLEWSDFIEDDVRLNQVRTYVYLKTRIAFDPPTTSYAISAIQKQIEELEWRLNQYREETGWTDPDPPIDPEFTEPFGEPVVADGGNA